MATPLRNAEPQASDSLARLALDQLPASFWETDRELRVRAAAGSLLRRLRFQENRVGRTLFENLQTSDPEHPVIAAHRRALGGEAVHYEFEMAGLTLRCHVEPARDRGGAISGVVGVAWDITDARKTEMALRARESELQAIIDAEPECVKIVDGEGRLLDMNAAGLAMIEADALEQVKNHPVIGLVAPHHRDAYQTMVRRVFAGGSETLEFEIVGLKGTRRWLETHAVPLNGPGGDVVAVLGVTRDITASRSALEQLRASERRLREAEQIAAIGSWEWDQTTGAVVWSDELYRLFGVARGSFTPTYDGFLATVHPDDRARVDRQIRQSARDGTPLDTDFLIQRLDGSLRIIHARGEVERDATGRIVRLRGTDQDVTERRSVEDALRRSQQRLRLLASHQQEVREEERARVAREIHDVLGQTLTALKLDAAWLREELTRSRPEIRRKVQDMTDILDGTIKTVRRISAELRPVVLDELGLAAAIEWLAGAFTRRTEIACHVDAIHDDPPLPSDIAVGLFRILQEALTNIARHAGAKTVTIALTRRDRVAYLEVTDDGKGFDPALIEAPESLGVLGMRERALLLGGACEITAGAHGGTRVAVWVPLP